MIIEGRETVGGGQIMTKRLCDVLSDKYVINVFIPGEINDISRLLGGYKLYHYKMQNYSKGKKMFVDYKNFIINSFDAYYSLMSLIKKEKYDLIYIQHLNILPFVVLACLGKHIPIVAHVHVVYGDKIVRKFVDFLLRRKVISQVIGVSHYSLSQFSEGVIGKSKILYNPIIIQKQMSPKCQSCKIAIVGDVMRSKGHHIVFESMNKLPNDYKLYVVGNKVDANYVEQLNKIYDKAIYTGMISNVSNYLMSEGISIVVIPSILPFETFSLAMIESWALGIPTIATDDFGMKELVNQFLSEYEEYMLFPLGDSELLQKKIMALNKDMPLYMNISHSVKSVAENCLSMQIFSKKIQSLVNNII